MSDELATIFKNMKTARFDNWDNNFMDESDRERWTYYEESGRMLEPFDNCDDDDFFMDESDRGRWEYFQGSGKILPKSQRVRSSREGRCFGVL